MNEFFNGSIVGIVQTIAGHPLDTIKTNLQFNRKHTGLYKGITYPLIGSGIINSCFFGFNNQLQKYNKNYFVTGFGAGLLTAPITNIFDLYKIRTQIGRTGKQIFRVNPMRGFIGTAARESISMSLYFGTYHYLLNYTNPFISGALTGVLCWTATYPIDVIKTRVQSDKDLTYREAYKQKKLWSGFRYCIARAIIVNALGFYVYDKLTNR